MTWKKFIYIIFAILACSCSLQPRSTTAETKTPNNPERTQVPFTNYSTNGADPETIASNCIQSVDVSCSRVTINPITFEQSDAILDILTRDIPGKCRTPDKSFGCSDLANGEDIVERFYTTVYSNTGFQPENPITVQQMIAYFGEPDQVLFIDREFMTGEPTVDIDFFYSDFALKFHSGQHHGKVVNLQPNTYVFSWFYFSKEDLALHIEYWNSRREPFTSKITSWSGYGAFTPFE